MSVDAGNLAATDCDHMRRVPPNQLSQAKHLVNRGRHHETLQPRLLKAVNIYLATPSPTSWTRTAGRVLIGCLYLMHLKNNNSTVQPDYHTTTMTIGCQEDLGSARERRATRRHMRHEAGTHIRAPSDPRTLGPSTSSPTAVLPWPVCCSSERNPSCSRTEQYCWSGRCSIRPQNCLHRPHLPIGVVVATMSTHYRDAQFLRPTGALHNDCIGQLSSIQAPRLST